MLADFPVVLPYRIEDARDAMADLLPQEELAETDGEQDAHRGKDKIEKLGMLDSDAHHHVADAVGQLLDDDGRQPCEETRRDADQQQELVVGQMGLPPFVELLNPLAYLLFEHAHFVLWPLN